MKASSGLSEMAGAKRKRTSPLKDNTKEAAVARRLKQEAKDAQVAAPARRSRRVAGLAIEGEENGQSLPKELKEPVVSKRRTPVDKPGDLTCENSLRAPEYQENHNDLMTQLREFTSEDYAEEESTLEKASSKMFSKLSLAENDCVKFLPDRIFSLQFHPSHSNVILAAGDKWGRIGIWNIGRNLAENSKPEESEEEEEISDEEIPSPTKKGKIEEKSGSESSAEDEESQEEETSDEISQNIVIYEPHSKPVTCVQWLGVDRLFSCGYDGRVRCLNLEKETFEEMHVHNKAVMWVATENLPENTALFALETGGVLSYDIRTKKHVSHQLREKKIYNVDVHKNGNIFSTSCLDSTVCLWDKRKIAKEKPLAWFTASKSITSAFFSKAEGNRIVATSYDNHLYCWDDVIKKGLENLTSINHNNNTGRWLTGFKPYWHPTTDDVFSVGSMDRSVEFFSASSGKRLNKINSDLMTTVPSLNAFHSATNMMASSNASGRVYLWRQ